MYEVFQFLLLLVFQGKNLFRFLNETSYNWSRFLLLLARVYDHIEHKCQRGFTLLTLGWSDG